jgi:hypothetical protein
MVVAGVGVAGGFLHIAQWNPGVECGGDKRVAQGVRPDAFGDSGVPGDAPHDASRRVTIDPFPGAG